MGYLDQLINKPPRTHCCDVCGCELDYDSVRDNINVDDATSFLCFQCFVGMDSLSGWDVAEETEH